MDIKENTIKIEKIEPMESEHTQIENFSCMESTIQDLLKDTNIEFMGKTEKAFSTNDAGAEKNPLISKIDNATATASVVKQENEHFVSNIKEESFCTKDAVNYKFTLINEIEHSTTMPTMVKVENAEFYSNIEEELLSTKNATTMPFVVKPENAECYSNIEVKEEYELTSYTFTNEPEIGDNELIDDIKTEYLMSSSNEAINYKAITSTDTSSTTQFYLNYDANAEQSLVPSTSSFVYAGDSVNSNSIILKNSFATATTTNPPYLTIFSFKSAYINCGLSYTCKLCSSSKKFYSASAAKIHIILTHFYKKFICRQCPKKFGNRALFRRHFMQNHRKVEFPHKLKFVLIKKLDEKNQLFNSRSKSQVETRSNRTVSGIRRAAMKHMGYFYICILCSKSEKYNSLYRIRKHIKMYHYGYSSGSSQCNNEYTKNHSNNSAPNQKSENFEDSIKIVDNFYVCNLCTNETKKSRSSYILMDHIKVQHYGYRYVCHECNIQYATSDGIRKHYKSKHKDIERPKKLKIEKIPEKAIQNSNLNIPKKFELSDYIKKDDDGFYVCTMCSESSKYETSTCVRLHVKLHHLNYRYVCKDCNEPFAISSMLRSHCKKECHFKSRTKKASSKKIKKPPKNLDYKSKYKLVDNNFCCTECSATYMNDKSMLWHIKVQHYGYRYVCTECGSKFVNWLNITKHYKEIHKMSVPKPLQMTQVDLVSNSTKLDDDVERPVKTRKIPDNSISNTAIKFESSDYIKQDDDGLYLCTLCSVSSKFKNAHLVRRHFKLHHLNGQYTCTDCNERFDISAMLRSHYKKVHNKECPIKSRKQKVSSNKIKESTNNLDYKSKYKLVDNTLCCTVCSATYMNETSMLLHIKVQHYGYRYICTECGSNFINWLNITQHYKETHKMSVPRPLTMTQLDVLSNSTKMENQKIHNDTERPRKFRIRKIPENSISTVLNRFESAEDHIKEDDDGSYVCTLCSVSAKFKNAHCVRRHIKLHHLNGRYVCPDCNEPFTVWSTLRSHYKKVHNKVCPYKLSMQKVSSNKIKEPRTNLSYENKYKIVDNTFHCTECPATYMHLRTMFVHIKIHHYGYRYVCTECGLKFTRWLSIIQHYKEIHRIPVPKPLSMTKVDMVSVSTKKQFNARDYYKKIDNYFICTMCTESEPSRYKSLMTVSHHIKVHHFGYRYVCTECNQEFSYQVATKKHCQKEHGKDYAYIFRAAEKD